MNGARKVKKNFGRAPRDPGKESKGQSHLLSITKSISKIFISNFVCVLTNERYKTYQTEFSLCSLGHNPGVGLWGAGGAQVVKKSNFQLNIQCRARQSTFSSTFELAMSPNF